MAKRKKKLVGDKIKEVTKKMGVEPCDGCNKRAEGLNTIHREFKRIFSKAVPLSEEQLKEWDQLNNRKNQNKLTPDEQTLIISILKDNLHMSVKPCINCGMGKWGHWIGLINDLVTKQLNTTTE